LIRSFQRPRLLAFVLGLAVFIWIVAPGPKAPERHPQTAEPWRLPQVTNGSLINALESLGKAGLWGTVPDATSAQSLNDPAWRFLGIVRTGPERFVLIKVDGQPEQKLSVNDILPGGSRILAIEDDTLCILIEGSKRRLGIYRTGPQIL
jgi:hypothetical protein